ncbi:MAG: hypothetical protein AUH43_23860 [Acidobacteria bacterium 13_1_40CM_65_14]|nr:MAG: hypothetical protein AUH43_23860 [Acidobacteria bacterium 13_1_40CM_65_14]
MKLVARPDDPIVAMTMYSESSAGRIEFVGRPNKKGFLGRVEGELQANNLLDAERRAYRTLAPALSDWSAQLDIPLRIWRIHVTAVETGATQISVINPFVEATVLSPTGILSPEYRGFSSLYREALESNSPAYQFLCLFKHTPNRECSGTRRRIRAMVERAVSDSPTMGRNGAGFDFCSRSARSPFRGCDWT